jgi:hypothetical protein
VILNRTSLDSLQRTHEEAPGEKMIFPEDLRLSRVHVVYCVNQTIG